MAINTGDMLVYNGTEWVNQQNISFSQASTGPYILVNAPSGSAAEFVEFQVAGVTKFFIDPTGAFTAFNTGSFVVGTSGEAVSLTVGAGANAGMRILQASGTGATKRVKVNLNNVYQFGTDSTGTSALDFWLSNNGTGNIVLLADAGDKLTLGSAASGVVVGGGSGTLHFFGGTPVAQQTGGVLTAGATYGTNEQSMLNKAYAAMRSYGLLT